MFEYIVYSPVLSLVQFVSFFTLAILHPKAPLSSYCVSCFLLSVLFTPHLRPFFGAGDTRGSDSYDSIKTIYTAWGFRSFFNLRHRISSTAEPRIASQSKGQIIHNAHLSGSQGSRPCRLSIFSQFGLWPQRCCETLPTGGNSWDHTRSLFNPQVTSQERPGPNWAGGE